MISDNSVFKILNESLCPNNKKIKIKLHLYNKREKFQ